MAEVVMRGIVGRGMGKTRRRQVPSGAGSPALAGTPFGVSERVSWVELGCIE